MKIRNYGFTLVELLIVIALIGILSVAVLATLNPIEQTNKARDAKFQNDAAEVLSALERYYATQQYYPWNEEVWGVGVGADSSALVGLTGRMPGMGICNEAGATYNNEISGDCYDASNLGELISTDELKTSFTNKDPFKSSVTDINRLYLLKETGASGSIYVCFIPKAKANRKTTSKLVDLGIAGATDVPASFTYSTKTQAEINAMEWSDRTDSLFKCVPE